MERCLLWPSGLAPAGGPGLPYTARILCKGRVTMEEIVFSLKHHWRFLNCKKP